MLSSGITNISRLILQGLGLQGYLLFAHGPELCSSPQLDKALADSFEAILGRILCFIIVAITLDIICSVCIFLITLVAAVLTNGVTP